MASLILVTVYATGCDNFSLGVKLHHDNEFCTDPAPQELSRAILRKFKSEWRRAAATDPGPIQNVYGNIAHTVPITDRRLRYRFSTLAATGPSCARGSKQS